MLNILLSGGFITMYYGTSDDRYVKTPAGHFIVFSEDDNRHSIKHTTNNSSQATKIKVSDIVTPAIGANSYEVYLEKLGQYLNGDTTVTF